MMEFFGTLFQEIKNFFGYGNLMKIIESGDYGQLMTYEGFTALLGPFIPILLVLEMIRAAFYKKFKVIDYKISFFTYVLNAFVGRVIALAMVGLIIGVFEKYALFQLEFTWYWFIYGYIVWEFAHFIYHFLAHKVRVLWCLHSTHHAPDTMNLSVTYAHFFLEAPYADLIRTTVCILLGVPPPMLFVIMFIDGTWGAFIHIGENLVQDARFGFLNRIILTPSHHRVHHAKNPLYMDTNFCNLLPVWDKAFGTYQDEDRSIPIEYGITRDMKKNSFLDAYFGEIAALIRDVKKAPGIKNKILYIFMPPGWSHTGEHKTSAKVREAYFRSLNKQQDGPSEVHQEYNVHSDSVSS